MAISEPNAKVCLLRAELSTFFQNKNKIRVTVGDQTEKLKFTEAGKCRLIAKNSGGSGCNSTEELFKTPIGAEVNFLKLRIWVLQLVE